MFKEVSEFEFVTHLEAHWEDIVRELEQIDAGSFLAWPEKYLYEQGWDIFGLYAFGLKIAKNCQKCPTTTRLVEAIPGMVTAGFSSLQPGTHIAPHTGYPDGVLRCHMGLVGCEGCTLRVGDETRSWTEGKCLVFDDTTEHEVWHRGSAARVVLLLDFKLPQVTDRPLGFWQRLWSRYS
ncbi:MAG: aspartyl/asparaginyl beta-hydroxylase domain-containing protein [Oscillatoriales cyanobacterium SM2_2_1]|nr:aspartyl/asparaginyl beta-hydroxylase domain-containing protein [Oscillatoriales cyanobacterium SM2_2_1]